MTHNLLDMIAAEVDTRFRDWAFRGSLVDWHYLDGQVLVKDFDIVTSDHFDPTIIDPYYGPRMMWTFLGRPIDVFYEPDVGPRMQTIEARVERLRLIAETYPHRRDKALATIERYRRLQQPQPLVQLAKTCHHRGDQLRTMTSDICGTRGHAIPVYACQLHGECTHRQACRGQDASVRICVGCDDGPWAAD